MFLEYLYERKGIEEMLPQASNTQAADLPYAVTRDNMKRWELVKDGGISYNHSVESQRQAIAKMRESRSLR